MPDPTTKRLVSDAIAQRTRLSLLFREIEMQCSYAIKAWTAASAARPDAAVSSREHLVAAPDEFWRGIDSFLAAAGRVSLLLWPAPRRSGEKKEVFKARERRWARRAGQVRLWLEVTNDSPVVSRKFRNSWTHFDETLHRLIDTGSYTFADQNYGPPDVWGVSKDDQYRGFNPEDDTLIFSGRTLEIVPLIQALEGLRERAQRIVENPSPAAQEFVERTRA